jgi:thiol:disulfide interchange protein
MPFGSMFGALFFGGLCIVAAAGLVGQPAPGGKLAGACLALLGGSLALGLLAGRRFARWAGVGCSLLVAVLALPRVADAATVMDHLLLLASLATGVLLALPPTGAPRGAPPSPRSKIGFAEAGAALGFVGLVAVALAARGGAAPAAGEVAAARPASAVSRSVSWADFAGGAEQARQAGKPVLATFVTSWCPYCSKMRHETWRDPRVAERLADVVPVRIDAEDPAQAGPELAERYRIEGYPVQMLLDPDGTILARADGYQTPAQFLGWLDQALERYRGRAPATASRTMTR